MALSLEVVEFVLEVPEFVLLEQLLLLEYEEAIQHCLVEVPDSLLD